MLDHCKQMGTTRPLKRDFERMALTGALPGENEVTVTARHAMFEAIAEQTRLQKLADDLN